MMTMKSNSISLFSFLLLPNSPIAMVSVEAAHTSVGVFGNIISLILFLSPVPTFIQIWKKKAVEQYSAVPYLAACVNCGLWALYGLPSVHPHSLLVTTINGSGFVIELIYLILFVIYSDPKKRNRILFIMLIELIFLGLLSLLVFTLAHTTKLRSSIVGSLAIVGAVMMYASPLSVVVSLTYNKLVITTKSVEYMPFFLSLFSFLNGISWTTYALIRFDPYILGATGMGSVLGLAQLILYATFYTSTKQQIEERKGDEDLRLA